MTPLEKQQSFHKELKELLLKYKAEITLDYNYVGYSSEEKIVVDFEYDESFFDEHGTGVIPQLVLGRFEDGKDY
jgi:hypothetical protein